MTRHFLKDDDLDPTSQARVLAHAGALKASPYAEKPGGHQAPIASACSGVAAWAASRLVVPARAGRVACGMGRPQPGRGDRGPLYRRARGVVGPTR